MTLTRLLYIVLFVTAAHTACAEEPRSALDNAPSVDSTASAPVSTAPPVSSITPAAKPSDAVLPPAPLEEAPQGAPQESYVYDLKRLINKSRENIKRVNEKIKEQAVVKRNQKREERARELYQRGLQLNEEGKLDEARECFEKAIRITEHPEMVKHIEKSESRLKVQEAALKREQHQQVRQLIQSETARQQEAQQSYIDAVRYYKEKKFKEAKDQFEHVEELIPDYKGTRSYLRILDQDIIREEALALKQQKREIERQNKDVETAREREKEAWKKEIEKKELERRDQVNKQAQEVYEQAVALYKEKKFVDAKKKLQEVEWVIPDYKATRNYLSRIDKDIIEETKRVEEEKNKALAEQTWQEEVARSKREAEEKKAAAEKEKAARKQMEEQANFVYKAAITMFDKKYYDEALEKFKDVEKTAPGYKSAKIYIAKIEQIKVDIKKKEAEKAAEEARQKVLAEEKAKRDEEVRKRRALEDEVEPLYRDGIDLYDNKKYAEAKEKLGQVGARIGEYKKAKYYFQKADEKMRIEQVKQGSAVIPASEYPMPQKPDAPPAAAGALSSSGAAAPGTQTQMKKKPSKTFTPKYSQEDKFDQIKQITELAQLVQISSQLYQQASLLSEDRSIVPVKRKMAEIVELLNAIMAQSQRLLKQIKDEEERAALEELKARIADLYEEAIMLLRQQKFDQAKIKFLEIESKMPNYKSTRAYLKNIDSDRRKAEAEALNERTRADLQRLKDVQEKQRIELVAKQAEDRERMRRIRTEQEALVRSLVAQATAINEEILQAAKAKDFDTVKVKFDDLSKILEQLLQIKKTMMEEEKKAELSRHWYQIKTMKHLTPVKMAQIIKDDPRPFKEQQALKEIEEDFHHGVKLIEQKKYTAAKIVFERLQERGDKRAQSYLNKISKALDKQISMSQSLGEKERREYIASHARREKQASTIAKLQAVHQREFAQEMDKQKKLAEESEQRQRMKLEALKVQQREREAIERKRQELQKKVEPRYAEFVKISRQKEEQRLAAEKRTKAQMQKKIKAAPPVKKSAPAKPVKLIPEPGKEETSLDVEAPPVNVTAPRVPAGATAIERVQAMEPPPMVASEPIIENVEAPVFEPIGDPIKPAKAPAKKSSRAPAKAPETLTAEPVVESPQVIVSAHESPEDGQKTLTPVEKKPTKEELAAQAKAQRMQEEFSRKRKEFLEMKYKKQLMEKAQLKKREQEKADREAREHELRLENERLAIKQQLLEGTKAMYAEAMKLYKKKNYALAAAKFQDIEDVMPDFKETRTYLKRAHEKAVALASTPVTAVDVTFEQMLKENSKPAAKKAVDAPPAQDTMSSSTSAQPAQRDAAIQNSLDIFDPNAQ